MANEKRLIDANEVEEMAGAFADQASTKEAYAAFWKVIHNIRQMPTVDAVEVVRCKDCKHWHEETGWCNQHSHFIGEKGEACHPWESNDWKMLNEDDFCSYGERKDNERV